MAIGIVGAGAESNLLVTVGSGDVLLVREFTVDEGISQLFEIQLVAVSESTDVDFEASIGSTARFQLRGGGGRSWQGVCAHIEQTAVDETGLATYTIRIVPQLWLLTQRRNYRVFQDMSELDIVLEVLADWGIRPRLQLEAGAYTKRRYRTQYAESDFDFVSRMMEDVGIAYTFEQGDAGTTLVLVDAPNRRGVKAEIPFVSVPDPAVEHVYATAVRTSRQVRPGKYTQSDVDYRKSLNYPLAASAASGVRAETSLERYHHNYGSFLWKGGAGGGTPHADDRGVARSNEGEGAKQVQKRLDAQRADARVAHFMTTDFDLAPGEVIRIAGHPRAELGGSLLVVRGHMSGTPTGKWTHTCEARYTDVDFRPALNTAKPRTLGVESATVTGPSGEEIHTDEFGRVRVHFHWDREGAADETSSCWVPVSQPWAGSGFGAISIPRVGQEVLVDFLGADPDRPIVLGRVFTTTTPPPYELPKHKSVSGMRSESYPRPKGTSQAQMGGGPDVPITDIATPRLMDTRVIEGRGEVWEARSRAPLGGGVPATALGGAADGAGADMPSLADIMPGTFGGPQAPLQQLGDAVSRMKSLGPDAKDAKRSANGFMADDSNTKEILYMQAQKDLRIAVKNNMVGGVGGNRAFEVLGNDFEGIQGYQSTKVGKDRTVEVTGIQSHTVLKNITVDGKENHIVRTQKDYVSQTVEGMHAFDSKTAIFLKVGDTSTIVMMPDAIVIDAPKVFINPGAVMMQALNSGKSATEAAAAAASEERINAGAKRGVDMLKGMHMDQSPEARGTLTKIANGQAPKYNALVDELKKGGLSDSEIQQAAQRADQALGPYKARVPGEPYFR